MALKKREKILAGVVGALLVVFAGSLLFSGGSGQSRGELLKKRKELTGEVEKKQQRVELLQKKVAGKMSEWNRRSLPGDPKLARPLYEKWLVGLLKDAGLEITRFDPVDSRTIRDVYTTLPTTIHAKGTLDQLTGFLFEFYSAGHLQKITRMTLKPIEDSAKLDLLISVEALSLPGAKQRTGLSTDPSGRLALADVSAYRRAIVRRAMESERYAESGGLFTPYAPPPPAPRPPRPPERKERKVERPRPPEPVKPSFDPAQYAFVTGILEVGGKPEVWIVARTLGQKFELHQGDPFHIGTLQGTIARIRVSERLVEIEVDGHRRPVPFGHSLLDAMSASADGS